MADIQDQCLKAVREAAMQSRQALPRHNTSSEYSTLSEGEIAPSRTLSGSKWAAPAAPRATQRSRPNEPSDTPAPTAARLIHPLRSQKKAPATTPQAAPAKKNEKYQWFGHGGASYSTPRVAASQGMTKQESQPLPAGAKSLAERGKFDCIFDRKEQPR